MTSPLPRQASLARIISEGIEPVLLGAKFKRAGKMTWARDAQELVQVVSLLARRESYVLQWGVACTGAPEYLWGHPPKALDVGYAVVSGTAGSIRHPAACQMFQLQSENELERINEIVGAIGKDVRVIEERLRDRPF